MVGYSNKRFRGGSVGYIGAVPLSRSGNDDVCNEGGITSNSNLLSLVTGKINEGKVRRHIFYLECLEHPT